MEKLGTESITVNVPINGKETIVASDATDKPIYEAYTGNVAGKTSDTVKVELSEDKVAPNPPQVDKAVGEFGNNKVIVTVPQNSDNRDDTDLRVGDKVIITVPGAKKRLTKRTATDASKVILMEALNRIMKSLVQKLSPLRTISLTVKWMPLV